MPVPQVAQRTLPSPEQRALEQRRAQRALLQRHYGHSGAAASEAPRAHSRRSSSAGSGKSGSCTIVHSRRSHPAQPAGGRAGRAPGNDAKAPSAFAQWEEDAAEVCRPSARRAAAAAVSAQLAQLPGEHLTHLPRREREADTREKPQQGWDRPGAGGLPAFPSVPSQRTASMARSSSTASTDLVPLPPDAVPAFRPLCPHRGHPPAPAPAPQDALCVDAVERDSAPRDFTSRRDAPLYDTPNHLRSPGSQQPCVDEARSQLYHRTYHVPARGAATPPPRDDGGARPAAAHDAVAHLEAQLAAAERVLQQLRAAADAERAEKEEAVRGRHAAEERAAALENCCRELQEAAARASEEAAAALRHSGGELAEHWQRQREVEIRLQEQAALLQTTQDQLRRVTAELRQRDAAVDDLRRKLRAKTQQLHDVAALAAVRQGSLSPGDEAPTPPPATTPPAALDAAGREQEDPRYSALSSLLGQKSPQEVALQQQAPSPARAPSWLAVDVQATAPAPMPPRRRPRPASPPRAASAAPSTSSTAVPDLTVSADECPSAAVEHPALGLYRDGRLDLSHHSAAGAAPSPPQDRRASPVTAACMSGPPRTDGPSTPERENGMAKQEWTYAYPARELQGAHGRHGAAPDALPAHAHTHAGHGANEWQEPLAYTRELQAPQDYRRHADPETGAATERPCGEPPRWHDYSDSPPVSPGGPASPDGAGHPREQVPGPGQGFSPSPARPPPPCANLYGVPAQSVRAVSMRSDCSAEGEPGSTPEKPQRLLPKKGTPNRGMGSIL
eukprot:TRINITY_DN13306_c0_g1_i2.p1 TRINITY_DN13306_c0_g1~~TRINITY_DN13306_c0_g1_i2.p1  ORF type:complete len:806 (+),score=169.54 TRINITY_DN13306_c0_g1_i2:55-2418(+)